MTQIQIISKLELNKDVFKSMFSGLSMEEILWKPLPEKWCLLEIVCHLYDEEREDFRARTKHALEIPEQAMPKIDPQGWVTQRKYLERDFDEMVTLFLNERDQSVKWLQSLQSPLWKNIYHHPTAGELSAEMFLSNWLAHDLLHFRQITYTKYQFLISNFNSRFDYAGNW
ncbi:MAG: DinB family protein [Bacteroidota bacterium]